MCQVYVSERSTGFQTTGEGCPWSVSAAVMERPKSRSLSLTIKLGKPVCVMSSDTAIVPPRMTDARFS